MSNLGWFECAEVHGVPDIWTPARTDAAFWLDPSSTDTVTLNTGRVTQIADKSGNGRHATQGVLTSMPITQVGRCGRQVLYFDGSRFLSLGTALGSPANFSVFAVGQFDITSSKVNICGSSNIDGTSAQSWGNIGTARSADDGKVEYSFGDGVNYGYGRTANVVITTGQMFAGGWVYGGGAKPTWYQDGIEYAATVEGSAIVNTPAVQPFSIGRNGDYSAGQYLIGVVAELLVWQRVLSAAELTRLMGYFAWKWGLV